MPTGTSPTHTTPKAVPEAQQTPRSRFVPGMLLGERYRIVALLGRGGMGEVYRADDLKLGQPVGLKFLPEGFARDPSRLSRFHNEVRIARQVSHPNVCRVHDIAEVNGQHLLSMEYVDGEDLRSLLKRIGRLTPATAVEMAREICAGLAAVHDQGVVHRDLKPANVMIDGRGRARLTDFGLAATAEELNRDHTVVGTLAYMAPEQLAGGEASIQSDIYALGLVLYEMFTGRRRFSATSLKELRAEHAEPTRLSLRSGAPEIDPAVERVVLRCLEKDPGARPTSVAEVLASLPGADPLQVATAAGETPSPEMVRAAGETGVLRPTIAWTCMLAGLALLSVNVARGELPLPKPPEVLAQRAMDVVTAAGYADPLSTRATDSSAPGRTRCGEIGGLPTRKSPTRCPGRSGSTTAAVRDR